MKPQLTEETIVALDKQLKQFSYSCMSNAKWKRVFIALFNNKNSVKHCEIYEYINPCINELRLEITSENPCEKVFNDYISEDVTTGENSTPYKYIEYIEFLKEWKTRPYHLAKCTVIKQDTDKIKEILSKVGLFEWEEDEKSLKLFGYKK